MVGAFRVASYPLFGSDLFHIVVSVSALLSLFVDGVRRRRLCTGLLRGGGAGVVCLTVKH
jgi:hypothetical protein